MSKYYRVFAEINLNKIRENALRIKEKLPKDTLFMGVVKAYGYGHGDIAITKALENIADYFGVATLHEAINLRVNGIKTPILILGYVPKEEYKKLIEYDICATIFTYEDAYNLSLVASLLKRTAKCHLKIDTGMNRIGFFPNQESLEEIKKIKNLKNLDSSAVFTHFHSSDTKDRTSLNKQYDTFISFLEECKKENIEFSLKHCSNSGGTLRYINDSAKNELKRNYALDMVRVGISLYGMYPSTEMETDKILLEPALALKSKVFFVKDVLKDEVISYGATYTTKEKMRVATISVGYGDGYPRRLSNTGYVIINGKKANILGRVCMDQMMVDVSDIEDIKRGDTATLIGVDGKEKITTEDLADMAKDTFNYEIVCNIGKRIPRIYYLDDEIVGDHDYFKEEWEFDI